MAVSNSVSITHVETQYSVDGIKTIVRFVWESIQTGDSFNNYYRTAKYTVTQNGKSQTYEVDYYLPKNAIYTIVDTYLTIDHDGFESASITVDTWMDTGISAGVIQKRATYTAAGDVLASLSVQNGTLGVAQKLFVYKRGNVYTHTITWTCGSKSGTICTKSKEENFTWTPPIDLAEAAPSGISVPVSFAVTTYHGNEAIGTRRPSITCAIPETNDFIPSLNITLDDDNGYKNTYGAYIQGQSKLKLGIQTYGAYGAWIVSCKTVFEGAMYSSTPVDGKCSVVSNTIANSGTRPVKVVVTDSRSRVTEANVDINVLAYRFPKIHSFTATRCNSDGTANDSGDHIKASFSAEIVSLGGKNTARYWVGYKKKGGSKIAVELTEHNGKYSVVSSYVFQADESSYDVIFTLVDGFKTVTQTITGAALKKVWSMLKKNDEIVGMAFGKPAEEEGVFDIGWKAKFSEGVAIPLLPNGTDLNNVVDSGTYYVVATVTNYSNCPENTQGFLEVMGCDADLGFYNANTYQRFTSIWNTFNQYERRKNTDGTWSSWAFIDRVVEQGTTDGWTYRKWSSGLAECWKTLTHTTTVATSWNSMYVGNATQRQNYPFSFIEKPVEIVTLTSGEKMGFIYPEQSGHGVNGAYASARYNVASLSSITTNATFYFNFYVTGKWR